MILHTFAFAAVNGNTGNFSLSLITPYNAAYKYIHIMRCNMMVLQSRSAYNQISHRTTYIP